MWCYMVVIWVTGTYFGVFDWRRVTGFLAFGWVFIVVPGVGAALAPTIDLLSTAVRRRDSGGENLVAMAAWDSYFQAHNLGSGMRLIPTHLSGLSDSFDRDDDDDGKRHLVLLVALLALACLFAGVVTATMIIPANAASRSDRVREELYVQRGLTR